MTKEALIKILKGLLKAEKTDLSFLANLKKMLTGTCKTINDSMFSLVSNLMIPLEVLFPVVLSVMSRNLCYLFLIITPYL